MRNRRKSAPSQLKARPTIRKSKARKGIIKPENAPKSTVPKKVTFDLPPEPPERPARRKTREIIKVCPPPEYCPLKYRERCPKVTELLTQDITNIIPQVEMVHLQHDLELLLSFATSTQSRAVGEVAFHTGGDYPIVDLSSRPSPKFFNRFVPELDDNVYTLENLDQGKQVSLCGLPVDEYLDDFVGWPPQNIHARFWKWCMETFLAPLDVDYLRDFKKIFFEPLSRSEMQKLYTNEPWKYRKREKPKGRVNAKKQNNADLRPPPRKKRAPTRDSLYQSIANIVNIVCRLEQMPPPPPLPPPPVLTKRVQKGKIKLSESRFASLAKLSLSVGPLLEAARRYEEQLINPPSPEPPKKAAPPTPEKLQSPRRSLRSPKIISPNFKLEPVEDVDAPVNHQPNGIHLNGKMDSTPVKTRRSSERKEAALKEIKKEILDVPPVQMNGTKPKRGTAKPSQLNGILQKRKASGKETVAPAIEEKPVKEELKPNRQAKKASEKKKVPPKSKATPQDGKTEKVKKELMEAPKEQSKKKAVKKMDENDEWLSGQLAAMLRRVAGVVDVLDGPTNTELFTFIEKIYHLYGDKILRILIAYKLLPSYVLDMFSFFLNNNLNLEISDEGRLPIEDEVPDEVSLELEKVQEELKVIEPELKGILSFCYKKLRKDFAYWETYNQLNEADNVLFRLVVNTYNEFPKRFPKPNEWPSILIAYDRHEEKAQLHYGSHFEGQGHFRMSFARPVDDPNEVEELR